MWFQRSTKGHLHVFEPGLSFPDQVLGQHRLRQTCPDEGAYQQQQVAAATAAWPELVGV